MDYSAKVEEYRFWSTQSVLSIFNMSKPSISISLIMLVALLMIVPTWFDSAVYNEEGRLASGGHYFRTADYCAFRVNPPLTSLIAAIPSLAVSAIFPTYADLDFTNFRREEYSAGAFFIKKNPNFRFLLFGGRVCCICLILFCFCVSLRYCVLLNGNVAPNFLIGLMLFSPYFLGHGHLGSSDVAAGVFALCAIYYFQYWLRKLNFNSAFFAGFILCLAELTRFTLLILYPITVILWVIYRFPRIGICSHVSIRRPFLQWLVLCGISLFVINIGYMFEGTGKLLRDYRFQTTLFTGYSTLKDIPFNGGNRFDGSGNFTDTALGYLPVPLPKNCIQGIDTQRLDFECVMPSYLWGKWSDRGWWYYYRYARLLKTPLVTIGLFVLTVFCTFFLKGYNEKWRDELVLLLPGIAIFIFISSQTGFSVHSRYAIPALPFFFLWTTKIARAFKPMLNTTSQKSSCFVRWLAVILLTWSIESSLWVYPHSIVYFNELSAIIPTPEDRHYTHQESKSARTLWHKIHRFLDAGPLNGPRHLLDSNVDWRQDYYALARWCAKHPETNGMITIDCYNTLTGRNLIPQTSTKRLIKRLQDGTISTSTAFTVRTMNTAVF